MLVKSTIHPPAPSILVRSSSPAAAHQCPELCAQRIVGGQHRLQAPDEALLALTGRQHVAHQARRRVAAQRAQLNSYLRLATWALSPLQQSPVDCYGQDDSRKEAVCVSV